MHATFLLSVLLLIPAALTAPIDKRQEVPIPYPDCSKTPDAAVCEAFINGDALHTVDEFAGHLGTQAGNVGTTAGEIIDEEGGDGTILAGVGAEIQHDLGSRDLKQSGADVASALYPAAEFNAVGTTASVATGDVQDVTDAAAPLVPGQSAELTTAGEGAAAIGAAAKYQFGVFEAGGAGHIPPSVDSLPDLGV